MNDTFLLEKAKRIKNERLRLGFTQQEVAEQCGIRRQQWIRYEKGLSNLDGKVLRHFARLGADAVYILGGEKSTEEELIFAQRQLQSYVFREGGNEDEFMPIIETLANRQRQAHKKSSEVLRLKQDILQVFDNINEIERLQMMKWATFLDKEDLMAVHQLVAKLAMQPSKKKPASA